MKFDSFIPKLYDLYEFFWKQTNSRFLCDPLELIVFYGVDWKQNESEPETRVGTAVKNQCFLDQTFWR